jgi:plastocyanin
MGIMLLYLAPGQVDACAPAAPLDVVPGKPAYPPVFRFPLPRQPTGPLARATSSRVSDFSFERPRVELRAGQRFTWSFEGTVQHDVTLVSGPVGFSAPWTLSGTFSRRFTKPGIYNLFCSLHPAQMSQQIVVRR